MPPRSDEKTEIVHIRNRTRPSFQKPVTAITIIMTNTTITTIIIATRKHIVHNNNARCGFA
ncbi:MAG: hypothetical protein ACKVZH_15585 [Blastocatellia bacterium]